jgi:uncharacterized protein (DUF305 family)
MKPSRSRSWFTIPAALLIAACGGGAGAGVDLGPSPSGLSPEEIEALYEARADSARQRYTEADVRFVTGMIHHHAQALVMADLAPSHDASASLRTLARRIINAQQDEIALMQRWLRDRDKPLPPPLPRDVDGWIAMNHPMLTDQQLRELDGARGNDFDRLFLSYMIQHHEGAVSMVHDLFDVDGAAQDEAVFKLASDIQVDQITEVERMRLMLAEVIQRRRPSAPAPHRISSPA